MTMLAVAPPWTTASSINLCCATPVLPVAIGQLSSPPLPLPKQLLNARAQQITSAENPIASDALLRPTSRGFLPWRFADAGPGVRGTIIIGRHPKTFTDSDVSAFPAHVSFAPMDGHRQLDPLRPKSVESRCGAVD